MPEKYDINDYISRLIHPFMVASITAVDNYLVSAYSCYGNMTWHRHLDEDELFIGYNGTAVIETSWGAVSLSYSELLTVPKGLPHRSSSNEPAALLLVQTKGMPARRNGHLGNGYSEKGRLRKVSLAREAGQLGDVYLPQRVAMSDSLSVSVQICLGAQQWHSHQGGQLIFCQNGRLIIQANPGEYVCERGQMVLVRPGELHRVVANEPATAMVLARV